jgi:uncharacterized membrane protein
MYAKLNANRPNVAQLLSASLILPLALACSGLHSQTDPQSTAIKVVERPGSNYKLDVYDNSDTYSQILAMNASGQMIGLRERVDETGAVFSQEYFFLDGKQQKKLPVLDGYTNTEVQAISDSGRAVGYASRPLGHPEGSLTAVVWDIETGQLTDLGHLPDDRVSQAQDISADGNRITGYSTGAEPARIRPCVWTWNAKQRTWDPEALSVIEENNPFIMSGGVVISPDGQRIAACITVKIHSQFSYDSSLFVWERHGEQWERKPVTDDQMHLKDINNAGQIAAAYTANGARLPVRVESNGDITQIELLKGDVGGEALGINAAGTVVGFSDDPHGPEGGPQPIVWRDGVTKLLELPESSQYGAATAINDRGQIAGMLDIELPNPEKSSAAEAEEPIVKTLAFRWTPSGDEKGNDH